jgi:antitoxin component YwqK of YwqJK toxin-antitoxin module
MGIFNFLKGKVKINKLEKNHENIDIICENGLNKVYYTSGKNAIKQRFSKKDGKFDGLFEKYYENGNIYRKYTYKNGCQVGKSYTYDEDGDLIRESELKNNESELKNNEYINEIKEFYKNGNLRIKININDNNKPDEYLLYTPEGTVKAKLYLLRKNINESSLNLVVNSQLKFISWNVEAEQNDPSNTEKLLPDLRNPIWTLYNTEGNKKLEIDFSAAFPACLKNKNTEQHQKYLDSGLSVCELREYNENSEIISRKNTIILQVDLSLFIHTKDAIFERRKNENKTADLAISNLAKDPLSVIFFDNILQIENFSAMHYLSFNKKNKDALANFSKIKEQRNWIKGFEILYKIKPIEESPFNVPYYTEEGEENIGLGLSYTKSHVVINTLNETDCMQLVHHIMVLNGGCNSFVEDEDEDEDESCIYRNQIIRIHKLKPQYSKVQVRQDSPGVDVYIGGVVVDLLPPKNLSTGDSTIPRGVHFDSEDINKVLLGLNKPVYCALDSGVGDGRFAVIKDNESRILLSHNEEFQIFDFKNIIRHFSKDNEILSLEDQEIKILLDSSDLLSKDIETATIINFKGRIREEDTVLCFTIKDKLMISMSKEYGRYSIRIDKLIDSDWKDLRINKKDKFKFHVSEI